MNRSLAAIFGAPIVLAALSLIGLVGALLADGLWDGLGAALLGAGLAVILGAWLGRPRPAPARSPSPTTDRAAAARDLGDAPRRN